MFLMPRYSLIAGTIVELQSCMAPEVPGTKTMKTVPGTRTVVFGFSLAIRVCKKKACT